MGGTVAIVLREPSGKVTPMFRWTNILPFYLKDPRLYSKDLKEQQAWVDEFLEEYLLMRADYKKNSTSGNYENSMTSCYFPVVGKVPYGYGLVYIDMRGRNLLSWQGYTRVETCFYYSHVDEGTKKNITKMDEAGYLQKVDSNSFTGVQEYIVKVRGWRIKDYQENSTGLKHLKQAMEKSGLTFTAREDKHWKAFQDGLDY